MNINREILRQSLKPVIVVVLICIFMWIWGNNRKVSVELTLRPELTGTETPTKIDMTVYKDGTEDVAASFSIPLSSDRLAIHHLDIKPGTYFMRGIVSTTGKSHIVTKTIVVPDDSASIEVYLRD